MLYFGYMTYMEKPQTQAQIEPLTPKIAIDYLNFKLKEKKDFLSYRDELVPAYFSAQWFCQMINELRTKIREYKKNPPENRENEKKWEKNPFNHALTEVVISKIRNQRINISTIKSLIGVLLHVFRDAKYRTYVNQTEKNISENFKKSPKEQEREDLQYIEKWLQNMVWKVFYKEIILDFWNQTKDQEQIFSDQMDVIVGQFIKKYRILGQQEDIQTILTDYLWRLKKILDNNKSIIKIYK